MARLSNKAANLRSALSGLWQAMNKALFDTYRPEQHYMRGPGPKWHAKHSG